MASSNTNMEERQFFCGLCPRNNASAYERGHKATILSKLAWPLVQVSLILYIASFSSSNWCDGQATETGVNGRIYAGAWRACFATEVNTTLHPNELPVAICSDTASYVVDGLKTGWVAAWRACLILSFLLLLLTSALLTVYVFGGRTQNHSTFPLFFAFASGFASAMFGAVSLLVFYVQARKAPELRGVPYGWAAGVNIGAVVTISYTIFLILGEHMEITDFRAARKMWRRRQHTNISDDATYPPVEGSSSWEGAENRNGTEASSSEPIPQAEVIRAIGVSPDVPRFQQQPSSVEHMTQQWQVPIAMTMFQTSSTHSEIPPRAHAVTVRAPVPTTAPAALTASASTAASAAPTTSAAPTASAAPTVSAVTTTSASDTATPAPTVSAGPTAPATPTASAAPTVSAVTTASASHTETPATTVPATASAQAASLAPTASPAVIASALPAQDVMMNSDTGTSRTVLPPIKHKTSINWSGNNHSAPESLTDVEQEEDRFRFRKVTLRKNRRPSQVDPGNISS